MRYLIKANAGERACAVCKKIIYSYEDYFAAGEGAEIDCATCFRRMWTALKEKQKEIENE